MQHFCTYFDQNYLLRGLTMYRSLVASSYDFTLHVLALDEEVDECIRALALPNLKSIPLSDLEKSNPALAIAKLDRSRIEYYFTLSPFLPLYVLDQNPLIEMITYLDADLFFYSSPDPIFQELNTRSILVCEHNYSAHLSEKLAYGRFNVQFQIFRRSDIALSCLRRWRDQCLEWCHDYIDNDRYADQKYLDEWPSLYGENLAVLTHPGGGVAPWNWGSSQLELKSDQVTAKKHPLLFYHFHGFKMLGNGLISNGLADWGVMPFRLRRWIYAGYLRRIRETRIWIEAATNKRYPLKDRFIRGKRLGLSSLAEVARKAWRQLMIVP